MINVVLGESSSNLELVCHLLLRVVHINSVTWLWTPGTDAHCLVRNTWNLLVDFGRLRSAAVPSWNIRPLVGVRLDAITECMNDSIRLEQRTGLYNWTIRATDVQVLPTVIPDLISRTHPNHEHVNLVNTLIWWVDDVLCASLNQDSISKVVNNRYSFIRAVSRIACIEAELKISV